MDTSKLKKFAQEARRKLLAQVEARLKTVLKEGSLARRESAKTITALESRIAESSEDHVIEQAAYTWFNRFCALRFMDVNRYTTIGTVSPADGFLQPEILTEAKQGVIDEAWKVDRAAVNGLLDGTKPSSDPQQEAYRLLLVGVCNHYNSLMPFMFEEIADYTELLMPDDLLSDNSVLTDLRQALYLEICSPEHTEQSVEVIGWLYQFYISEKKDDVFAALKKGKKITPENIPAATQLFTPHWIVRYLVENTLGRLWMLNHPQSKLAERMDYYIKPESPETDFLQIRRPEEIKICDPACGSGHMLTYAFDLLYAIYEEQGYQATDIPRLILTHNLCGIEIDQRAGALAAFALTMKAREKDRRFFTRGRSTSGDSLAARNSPLVTQPNICVLENIHFDSDELDEYIDQVGRNLFTAGLRGVLTQWEEADNFGSLIRPLVTDVSEVLEVLRERQMESDLFLAGVHRKVVKALRQADYLSPKYHVVVANPPYMGGKGMSPRMSTWLRKHFANVKSDLFSAFIVRNKELSIPRGQLGFMTPFVWMFIATYEKLRDFVLDEATISSLIQLEYSGFDGATVPICTFTLENAHKPGYRGAYIRLSDFRGSQNQAPKTLQAIANPNCGWFYRASAREFKRISGKPIAYWATPRVRALFEKNAKVGDVAELRTGMHTGDNPRFLRYWHEVSQASIGFGMQSAAEACDSGLKWFPYNKGGSYRKWFGNNEYVVNWQHNGAEIHAFHDLPLEYNGAPVRAKRFQFLQSITWTATSSSYFGVRHSDSGFLFDVKGSSGFCDDGLHYPLLGYLATPMVSEFLQALNPTIEFQNGNLKVLPLIPEFNDPDFKAETSQIVQECVAISRRDWDSFESSWEFASSPLLPLTTCNGLVVACQAHRENLQSELRELQTAEQRNNEIFITAYGLSDEIAPQVPLDAITLTANPHYRYGSDKSESELEALLLADTMREFISYAVGCMLGRFSLDAPGLILANQGESIEDYYRIVQTKRVAGGQDLGLVASQDSQDSSHQPLDTCHSVQFEPDVDNVIPLLDGDWFTDDISERFKEFLKVTFGTEHYEENLTFLENALYPDNLTGKKRKTIRDYFLKDFYNHHIKLYKKRPIYWLFSSPKGTFNALIYMHRYRPDTVSVVLKYLRDFQTKLQSHMMHQQSIADSVDAKPADKTKALKQVTQLTKDLKELADYERKVIYPLASQRIEIDLDNGVKHNYPLFGEALKKIAGMEAKEDE